MHYVLVDEQDMVVAFMIAKAKAIKAGKAHNTSGPKLAKSTMKWPPYLSIFIVNKMCEIIKSGVRTNKGFKEVHLNNIAKKIFDYCQ
jgi:hypothetical protein